MTANDIHRDINSHCGVVLKSVRSHQALMMIYVIVSPGYVSKLVVALVYLQPEALVNPCPYHPLHKDYLDSLDDLNNYP